MPAEQVVRIEPWRDADLMLLRELLSDPATMEHLGGPESGAQIVARHARYLAMTDPAAGQMFSIVDDASGEPVGSVGYWERDEQGEAVYEAGWFVLPRWQGCGIAVSATAQWIDVLRALGTRRYLYAYPGVDNPASNAICRKLGFVFLEAREFEYPAGQFMQCNVWRLDLVGSAAGG